jgi:hypothetical protein
VDIDCRAFLTRDRFKLKMAAPYLFTEERFQELDAKEKSARPEIAVSQARASGSPLIANGSQQCGAG